MSLNVFIAYCSPAGSTQQAAEMINEVFSARNVPVQTFDIGKDGTPDGFIKQLTETENRALLDQLVEHLITADQTGALSCLEQSVLDYQPDELTRTMKPKVNDALSPIAKSINQDGCTQ